MNNKIEKRGNFSIILTFILLLSTYPYVCNRILPIPSESVVSFGIAAIFIVLFFKRKAIILLPKPVIICMIIQIVVWFFYRLWFNDTSYISRIFYIVLTFLICNVLLIDKLLIRFVNYNNKLVAFQAFLGVIAFVLILTDLLHPLFEFENIDGRNAYFYGITCTNSRLNNFIRVAGFFDEPGALAYWGIFALLFNKVFINNKKLEYILIISLLFTFSAAYFIELFVYIILFYNKNIKVIIWIVLIAFVLFCILSMIENNEFFMHLTLERFSDNGIESKRNELTEMAYLHFKESPLLGKGALKIDSIEYMGDNPYEILAKDGIVGYVVTYLPLFYLFIRCLKYKIILSSSIILFIDYQQRPFHVNEMHALMLYLFMILVVLKYDRKIYANKSVC